MLLKLLQEAVKESKVYGTTADKTLQTLKETVGKDTARKIFEGYQIQPDDYSKWLDVISGYAKDEGINIKTKAAFQDVAYAVLENDPAPIDSDMQDAIVSTLWANFKVKQEQSKVDKVVRAKEEEEQLKYALGKMKNRSEENEEDSGFAQLFKTSKGIEDEEFDPQEEFDPSDMDEDRGDRDRDWKLADKYADDWWATEDADQNDLPFDEESDARDEQIISRGRQMQRSRDLEDYDPASDEGMDQDRQIIDRGRRSRHEQEIQDFDVASEQEEVSNTKSPFQKGQTVVCKKDKSTYTVEIPDGPGDQVGILVNGQIKMVPSKHLESIRKSEENEESQSKSSTKTSFLHDVLTGENSRDNLNKLQKQIEIEAANEWTRHHAKLPKNPHPKGSIAYKAWERGITRAAKEVWAPTPVNVDPKAKQKPKKK